MLCHGRLIKVNFFVNLYKVAYGHKVTQKQENYFQQMLCSSILPMKSISTVI